MKGARRALQSPEPHFITSKPRGPDMQNQFVDLYRNGIKTTTELARVSLENCVKLQERQLGIVKNILDENRIERMAELWAGFVGAAIEQQKAWIDQVQSQVGQAREHVRENFESSTSTAANQVSRA